MELARQQESGAEGQQQQSRPGTFAHRAVERFQSLGIHGEPFVETAESAEDAEQREQPDGAQRHQLDHGLEGDGHHQAFMFLPRRDVARAEKNGEQGERHAKAQRQHLRRGFLSENLHRFRNREDL